MKMDWTNKAGEEKGESRMRKRDSEENMQERVWGGDASERERQRVRGEDKRVFSFHS